MLHLPENIRSGAQASIFLSNLHLKAFNISLENCAVAAKLNEEVLEDLCTQLERMPSLPSANYWLTWARLNELALLCAGNYADSDEYSAAGDLLANPRLIAVHTLDAPAPIPKWRHGRLTDQFAYVADNRCQSVHYLMTRTMLETRQEALLPTLYSLLKNSGRLCQAYLNSARHRMDRIAEVLGLLASWHLPADTDPIQGLQTASKADREFLLSKLCRFDDRLFQKLGHEIERLFNDEGFQSEFLC